MTLKNVLASLLSGGKGVEALGEGRSVAKPLRKIQLRPRDGSSPASTQSLLDDLRQHQETITTLDSLVIPPGYDIIPVKADKASEVTCICGRCGGPAGLFMHKCGYCGTEKSHLRLQKPGGSEKGEKIGFTRMTPGLTRISRGEFQMHVCAQEIEIEGGASVVALYGHDIELGDAAKIAQVVGTDLKVGDDASIVQAQVQHATFYGDASVIQMTVFENGSLAFSGDRGKVTVGELFVDQTVARKFLRRPQGSITENILDYNLPNWLEFSTMMVGVYPVPTEVARP